jgi:GT2 family glycosyltransferase
MIVFGVAVSDEQQLGEWALPGIERVAEPDSRVITQRGFDSVQVPYNRILDEAARIPDLEAVILLHQDTEIDDPLLLRKLRHALADPRVAVVGPIGGSNVSSIAWWEGTSFGRVIAPNVGLDRMIHSTTPFGWHLVEVIDGLMLALSPWAAREVRFDERFAQHFHGYDVDYCFQVRQRGRQCLVGPLQAIHYGTWKAERSASWIEAELSWQRKWGAGGLLPRPGVLAWA